LDEGPVDEELGRQFSHAIVSNPRITDIGFHPNRGVDIRDLIAWVAGRKTLIHMTNLQSILFSDIGGMSEQDCDLLFSLLLTSASLKRLAVILKRDTREDPFIAAFCHYLSGTTFLKNLTLHDTQNLSRAAWLSLCDGVTETSLRKLSLWGGVAREANLKIVAEYLAWAIVESSLDVVAMESELFSALTCTAPVRNLDLVFSTFAYNDKKHLRINRNWKPLLRANLPLGLWPYILEKVHASPETSHSPAGILFFLLREKPNLVPSKCPYAGNMS
jgi:hypothetical protein